MDADLPNLVQMDCPPLAGLLAEALVARMPDDAYRCFFTNSGAESIETVLKFARGATGRSRILFADHAFHGLTTGALSLNGGREFRDGFGDLLPGCQGVAFGDLDSLRRELEAGDVAAFVVEPIQGKGVFVAPGGLSARGRRPVPPARRAPRRRRGADRARANRHALRLRAVGRRPRHRHGGQGAVGWIRPRRRRHRQGTRRRGRLRQDGSSRGAQHDVRPERARDDRRPRHPAHDRRRTHRRTRPRSEVPGCFPACRRSRTGTRSCTRSGAAAS